MTHGIDHLVLAAHDMRAQADVYRRLGFTVGAQNRHPWGTLNHIIQFPGTFLELITTEPGFVRPSESEPVAQFAGFLADYLARREGFAMLVLESPDAASDQAAFAAGGISGGFEHDPCRRLHRHHESRDRRCAAVLERRQPAGGQRLRGVLVFPKPPECRLLGVHARCDPAITE
jgi:hypothetical protein